MSMNSKILGIFGSRICNAVRSSVDKPISYIYADGAYCREVWCALYRMVKYFTHLELLFIIRYPLRDISNFESCRVQFTVSKHGSVRRLTSTRLHGELEHKNQ